MVGETVRRRPEPGPRAGAVLGYHQARDQLLLFGGAAYGSLADTWLWRGTRWEPIAATDGPPPRHDASLA